MTTSTAKPETTFRSAADLAAQYGMTLTPGKAEGSFDLTNGQWIIHLQPEKVATRPKIWHEPGKMGPKLRVPRHWNLTDAVWAAIAASDAAKPKAADNSEK